MGISDCDKSSYKCFVDLEPIKSPDIKKCVCIQRGYILSNNACISDCPNGYFNDLYNYGLCVKCSQPSCRKCSEYSNCIYCETGFILDNSTGYCSPVSQIDYILSNGVGTLVKNCGQSLGINFNTNLCQNCRILIPGCTSCTSENNCNICIISTSLSDNRCRCSNLSFYFFGPRCNRFICPQGYYGNFENICKICDN